MMYKLFLILVGLLFTGAASAGKADPVTKELYVLSFITGFHASFNQDKSLEFRVLESDGSGTVALNPITLYLVVTNNAPDDEAGTRVVKLPSVSEVTRVSFDKKRNIVSIQAKFDRVGADGSITPAGHGTILATPKLTRRGIGDIQFEVRK